MHEIFTKGLNLPAPKGVDVAALAELAEPGADANKEPNYQPADVIAIHSYLQLWWNALRKAKGAPVEGMCESLTRLLEERLELRAPKMQATDQRLRKDLEAVVPALLGAYPLTEGAISPDTNTGSFNTGSWGPSRGE